MCPSRNVSLQPTVPHGCLSPTDSTVQVISESEGIESSLSVFLSYLLLLFYFHIQFPLLYFPPSFLLPISLFPFFLLNTFPLFLSSKLLILTFLPDILPYVLPCSFLLILLFFLSFPPSVLNKLTIYLFYFFSLVHVLSTTVVPFRQWS